jgi:sugar/nucleoside kinase (ribokinase family)
MAAGAKGCVIKLGAEGAYLAAGGLRHLVPAHRIEVVDTTSCGDAFCAGFMAAHAQRWDIESCVRFAMATAALVAQDLGTLGRLQSFEDTQAFMSRTPVADRQRA